MTSNRSGKPSLSPEHSGRVLAAATWLLTHRFGDNRTRLGKAIGRSQPAITQLISGLNRPSYETAEAVASQCGVETHDLLSGRWKPGDPVPPKVPTTPAMPESDPRYPNRGVAISLARDVVYDRAIELLRDVTAGEDDKSVAWWLNRLTLEQLVLEGERARSVQKVDEVRKKRFRKLATAADADLARAKKPPKAKRPAKD